MRLTLIALLAGALAAGSAVAAAASWRAEASPDDVNRLQRLERAWAQALRQARRGGGSAELKALGVLAQPDAALPRPHPAPGDYRCRTVKMGLKMGGEGSGVLPYGWFQCRVELTPGGDLRLAKTTGSQRPGGHLYPETSRRLVYLGAAAWGDERPIPYGRDPERDQIGVFERIGPQRYRLVLPFPKQESTLDIIELRR
jgi:hypothetical protein